MKKKLFIKSYICVSEVKCIKMSHENREGIETVPTKQNALTFERRVSGFEPDPAPISVVESNSNMVVLTRDTTSPYSNTQVHFKPGMVFCPKFSALYIPDDQPSSNLETHNFLLSFRFKMISNMKNMNIWKMIVCQNLLMKMGMRILFVS